MMDSAREILSAWPSHNNLFVTIVEGNKLSKYYFTNNIQEEGSGVRPDKVTLRIVRLL